jgi:hypothetical protein
VVPRKPGYSRPVTVQIKRSAFLVKKLTGKKWAQRDRVSTLPCPDIGWLGTSIRQDDSAGLTPKEGFAFFPVEWIDHGLHRF